MTSEEYKTQIRQARFHFKNQEYQAAKDIYAELLGHYPDRFWPRYLGAICLSELNRPFECEQELQECILRFPEKVDIYHYYAFFLSNQGYYRDALKQFQICWNMGMDSYEFHLYFAGTYIRLDDFENAIHHLTISLRKKITFAGINLYFRYWEIQILRRITA